MNRRAGKNTLPKEDLGSLLFLHVLHELRSFPTIPYTPSPYRLSLIGMSGLEGFINESGASSSPTSNGAQLLFDAMIE